MSADRLGEPPQGASAPRRRILFLGKVAEGSGRDAARRVGQALGWAAARSGHRLLASSDAKGTVDRFAVEGALDYVRHHPDSRLNLEIHELDDGRRRFADLPPQGRFAPDRRSHPPNDVGKGRWALAHLAALDRADVLVAMGGSKNTDWITRVAEARREPVIAIPEFGGAARDAHARLAGRDADMSGVEASLQSLDVRQDNSGLRAWAAQLLDMVASLVRRSRLRTYFLSYAREDTLEADEVELFLRRANRGVIRDEHAFPPGATLPDEIAGQIRGADDFLVLPSDSARSSAWVRQEIALAHEWRSTRARSGSYRLLSVVLDGQIPSTMMPSDHVLELDGGTRLEREMAVERIIKKES